MSQTPASMVDWNFAVAVGRRTAGTQPVVSEIEAAKVVSDLRAGAERAAGLVNDWCGLGGQVGLAPLHVVDRAGWVEANAQTFATLMDPIADRIATRSSRTGLMHEVGSRVAGAETGALLGFMASKVLGQFDPFHGEHGRLLLVAPNVVKVEREIDVDPEVFRFWVCLHEEAHRVQFTSVPWLADHVRGLLDEATSHMDVSSFSTEKLTAALRSLRGGGEEQKDGSATPNGGLLEAFASPAQRELLDRVTGVMSLLEGHADVVMDGVGDEAIGRAEVRDLRRRFNTRRKGAGQLDRTLRRLLGFEAKMAQYRDGYRFVEGVTARVGRDGFNEVFAEPANLPSKAEILSPTLWVERVHGNPA